MVTELPKAETELVTIRYTASDRVEVRFKSGVRFTANRIAEMMKERARLGASGPHRVLMLMPEVIDFDPNMVQVEHYTNVPQPNTEAVAWVAHNLADAHITKLVVERGRPTFPWKVFLSEAEARAWLEEPKPGSGVLHVRTGAV